MKVIIPVLHNVSSSQKVVEVAKLVYGLGYKNFIVTKATGSAAQIGIPDAQKIALKRGTNFFYLGDIDDVIELFKPDLVLTIVPKKYTSISLEDVINDIKNREKILLIFGGLDPGLSKIEIEKGTPVSPPQIEENIGTIGLIAITLHTLLTITKL